MKADKNAISDFPVLSGEENNQRIVYAKLAHIVKIARIKRRVTDCSRGKGALRHTEKTYGKEVAPNRCRKIQVLMAGTILGLTSPSN
jgi:hypothetical protein